VSEPDGQHHLLAILAADMTGYSRLMSLDERATLGALDAARVIFKARIEAHRGRVIDTAGDSVLAVFGAVQGAVGAALDIQRDLNAAADRMPADRQARYRIGVHLGDVIERPDGTVYGDGVNIAARLQARAAPGGICLSQNVYDLVQGKVAMQADFAGRESFKNIAEAIPIWLVTQGGTAKTRSRRWLPAAVAALAIVMATASWYSMRREASSPIGTPTVEGKSLAVLPFASLSDDKDMAYFADGVQEDLLTQLALLSDLKVVSRTSVMDYRNSRKGSRQIGAELGVAALVEGSVRRAGNQVRVTAQLIDARSDRHLWAKSYDRDLKDIFAIQSELATEISRSLHVALAPQERARLVRKPTDNLEAYDFLLRYHQMLQQAAAGTRTASQAKERIALLEKAVELDPNFAVAWARLAREHARAYWFGVDTTPERLTLARQAMERAVALAPDDPQVMIEQGGYYLDALNDEGRAERAYEQVLRIAPYNVNALVGLADVRLRQMRWGDRVPLLERVLTVDARNVDALARLSNTYAAYRHYDRALALRQRVINIRPNDPGVQARYQVLEYQRTGSWDAYDKWRPTVPKDANTKFFFVWELDAGRALARRDLAETLRLNSIVPEDVRGLEGFSDEGSRTLTRALVTYALGARPESLKMARAALPLIEAQIRKTPESENFWRSKAIAHAMLGEREPAFAALAQSVAVSRSVAGAMYAGKAASFSAHLHALLGDRELALSELEQNQKLPDAPVHDLAVTESLASLWDDPKFKTLIADPANNAPLPFDTPYAPKR